MQYLQVRQLLIQSLDLNDDLYLVLVQVQRLELGYVLGNDLHNRVEHNRLAQPAEIVLQVGIRVELGQIQRFRGGIVTFRHRQLHFFFHVGAQFDVRRSSVDPDYHPEAVRTFDLAVEAVELLCRFVIVDVESRHRTISFPLKVALSTVSLLKHQRNLP